MAKSKNLTGVRVVCSLCPIVSRIPEPCNPLARRCEDIVTKARHAWGYLSPEEQLLYYEVIDGVELPKKFPPYSTLKRNYSAKIF